MTGLNTFVDERMLPYPFCPGCSHSLILDGLNSALVKLGFDPKKVVIVTDIGCVGLSDKYFITNTFHGLHGRSITYGTGIKLANPELTVIVLMGDGACGIGGHHLINAARRNIGLTTIVFNNLNYGMTGGENSVTSPLHAITSSTPQGVIEQPMDICGTAAVNGGTFIARTTAYNKILDDLIKTALQNNGFSLIDVWELCTAYYAPNNHMNKSKLEDSMSALGFKSGVLVDKTRDEFSQAIREQWTPIVDGNPLPPKPIEKKYQHQISRTEKIIIAGAAGAKIGSAAAAFCRGAILAGLNATQRSDHMVTVKTGYSISEVVLSTDLINYTTIQKPNRIVLAFSEGLPRMESRIENLDQSGLLYINASLLPVKTRAQVFPMDFQKTRMRKQFWTVMALAEVLRISKIYPIEAFIEALKMRTEFADKNINAVENSIGLLEPD